MNAHQFAKSITMIETLAAGAAYIVDVTMASGKILHGGICKMDQGVVKIDLLRDPLTSAILKERRPCIVDVNAIESIALHETG